jgi:hypothetical protein
MKSVRQAEIQRSLGQGITLSGHRHILDPARDRSAGIVVGIEVARGPLLQLGQLQVCQAAVRLLV